MAWKKGGHQTKLGNVKSVTSEYNYFFKLWSKLKGLECFFWLGPGFGERGIEGKVKAVKNMPTR